MAWFKRQSKGIQTPTEEKKDIPKGLWYKSPTGKIVDTEELQDNFYVSPEDDYHVRIGSREYFSIIFDDKFKELVINKKQATIGILFFSIIKPLSPLSGNISRGICGHRHHFHHLQIVSWSLLLSFLNSN